MNDKVEAKIFPISDRVSVEMLNDAENGNYLHYNINDSTFAYAVNKDGKLTITVMPTAGKMDSFNSNVEALEQMIGYSHTLLETDAAADIEVINEKDNAYLASSIRVANTLMKRQIA